MINLVNAQLSTDIFYLSMFTIFSVFVLLVAALLTFKQPEGVSDNRKNIKWSVEFAWALIPFVMLFVMLVPIIRMMT